MHADSHDLFLAHSGADRAAAEELFDLLAPDVRVWLDTRSLMLGDEWPVEIPRAQRAAMATVILVSRSADHAYYLRDEIHTAVALHRSFPDEHRAVAVFLDGRPADPMQVPYGLRILNSLDALTEKGLEGVARKLRELVRQLRARGVSAASPPAPRRGPAPLTGEALYDKLCKLTHGAQIDAVILRAGLPRQHIRPATAPVSQRAIDIVHLVDDSGLDTALRVANAIAKEAPYLGDARAAGVAQTASASGSREPPRPQGRVRVLLVFANPRGTLPLRLGAEERALKQSTQLAAHRDRLEIETLHAATIDDLRRALLEKPRTIVHFSGHGEAGGLKLEDEMGDGFSPDVATLGSLLRRRGVETVLLNACYSLAVIKAAPMGARYTVAMDGAVSDAGAVEFSRGFYDVIGAGGGVEDAYLEGCDCARIKHVPVSAELIKA